MSSRVRGKEAARARAAELRAAQARSERRRRVVAASTAIVVVIALVAVLVVVKLTSDDDGSTTASTDPGSTAAPSQVVDALTNVPAAAFDTAGATGVSAPPAQIDAPALTADGKPRVLYVGAEYCPYCAAERWPVIIALSRFGTWSGLGATASASEDIFPNTPTLSFHGATYTSDYLNFAGYETQTNIQVNGQYTPLDPVPAGDQRTFQTYNNPPYVAQGGSIPFIDIGGKYVVSGAGYSPKLLAGRTRAEIAKAATDPSTDLGKAVLANANLITAAICESTGAKPAAVCTSSAVKAATTELGKAQDQ